MFKLSVFSIFFLLSFLSSVLANEVVPGSEYRTTNTVETLSGTTIDAGELVEALAVSDVADAVSPSGQLLTFKYQKQIFNADFDGFEQALSDYRIRYVDANQDAADADVCFDVFHSDTRITLPPLANDIALTRFVSVFDGDGMPVVLSRIFSRPNEDGNHRLCLGGLTPATAYRLTLKKGYPLHSCRAPNAEICSDEKTAMDVALKFTTAALKSSILVDNSKLILPLADDAVIPVRVTNISDVSYQLFRIQDRQVAHSSYLFNNLDEWDIDSYRKNTDLVAEGTLTPPHSAAGQVSFNIDVSELHAGLTGGIYALVLDSPSLDLSRYNGRPTQWFVRSDIGISLYRGANETVVQLQGFRDLDVPDEVKLDVISASNRLLYSAPANDAGLLWIPNSYLNGADGAAPAFLMAYSPDGDFSLLSLKGQQSGYELKIGGAEKPHDVDVLLSKERGSYRLGDTLTLAVMARHRDLSLADVPVLIEFSNPLGEKLGTQEIEFTGMPIQKVSFPIKESYPLGSYTIRALGVDDTILATTSVNIADFAPLTIEGKIEPSSEILSASNVSAKVSARYFSGGVAAQLKADLTVRLSPRSMHRSSDLEGFVFGGGESTSGHVGFDGFVLDEDGTHIVEIDLDVDSDDLGGFLYDATMVANIFDVGGRPNPRVTSRPLDTQDSYLGVKPDFEGYVPSGSESRFDLVRITRDGTVLDLSEVSYGLSRVDYVDQWSYSNGWRYTRSRALGDLVLSGTTSDPVLTVPSTLPNGIYELSISSGDGSPTLVEFQIGMASGALAASTPLRLEPFIQRQSDETAKLSFTSAYDGVVTVIIASDDIRTVTSVPVSKGENNLTIDTPTDVEPGFHVLVTTKRPVTIGSEYLPQVSVGATWVSQISDTRKIEVTTETKSEIRSTESLDVAVKTNIDGGKAILFVVDEGIHSLTNFRNPDPVKHYFGKRELLLDMKSNFGQLIKQDRNLKAFRVGGDEMAGDAGIRKSRFFKTVAMTSPILDIENGMVSHDFGPLEFEGKVRIVAIVGDDKGVQQNTVHVVSVDPVSLDVSLPRFVAVGDEVNGRVGIRANKDVGEISFGSQIGDQQTALNIGSLVQDALISEALPFTATLAGDIPVTFDLQTGDQDITRDFNIVSRLPSYPMSVMRSLTVPRDGLIANTRIQPLKIDSFDLKGQEELVARVTVSELPGAGMAQVLAALDRYPYGCIEQISSGIRGLVHREALLGRDGESGIDKIETGLATLVGRQKSSGAFGYWSRGGTIYKKYQPYVLDTFVLALPLIKDKVLKERVESSLSRGLRYLARDRFDLEEPRLVALALRYEFGEPVEDDIRYMLDEVLSKSWTDAAMGYWAADLIGDAQRKRKFGSVLRVRSENFGSSVTSGLTIFGANGWQDPTDFMESYEGSYWERYSQVREQLRAASLLARVPVRNRDDFVSTILRDAVSDASRLDYRSTRNNADIAWILGHARPKTYELTLNGKSVSTRGDGTLDVPVPLLAKGFSLSHSGDADLFLTAEVTGPRISADEIRNGFAVRKWLFDADGDLLDPTAADFNLEQGELVQVLIMAAATDDHRNGQLLITDYIPSGFEIETKGALFLDTIEPAEIINLTGDGDFRDFILKDIELSEAMDDRFMVAFNEGWFDKGKFRIAAYVMRAVYPGDMRLPDAHAELMYSPQVNGRSATGEVRVVSK
jgi:uncharacterized protein YfaS (alpha-2-macroglobulin family)